MCTCVRQGGGRLVLAYVCAEEGGGGQAYVGACVRGGGGGQACVGVYHTCSGSSGSRRACDDALCVSADLRKWSRDTGWHLTDPSITVPPDSLSPLLPHRAAVSPPRPAPTVVSEVGSGAGAVAYYFAAGAVGAAATCGALVLARGGDGRVYAKGTRGARRAEMRQAYLSLTPPQQQAFKAAAADLRLQAGV